MVDFRNKSKLSRGITKDLFLGSDVYKEIKSYYEDLGIGYISITVLDKVISSDISASIKVSGSKSSIENDDSMVVTLVIIPKTCSVSSTVFVVKDGRSASDSVLSKKLDKFAKELQNIYRNEITSLISEGVYRVNNKDVRGLILEGLYFNKVNEVKGADKLYSNKSITLEKSAKDLFDRGECLDFLKSLNTFLKGSGLKAIVFYDDRDLLQLRVYGFEYGNVDDYDKFSEKDLTRFKGIIKKYGILGKYKNLNSSDYENAKVTVDSKVITCGPYIDVDYSATSVASSDISESAIDEAAKKSYFVVVAFSTNQFKFSEMVCKEKEYKMFTKLPGYRELDYYKSDGVEKPDRFYADIEYKAEKLGLSKDAFGDSEDGYISMLNGRIRGYKIYKDSKLKPIGYIAKKLSAD